jgi:hypothetical protein
MSQIVEAEIFDFCRTTSLFEGIVDGTFAVWDHPKATERESHRNNSLGAIPAPIVPGR